jgi:hypothetical protein
MDGFHEILMNVKSFESAGGFMHFFGGIGMPIKTLAPSELA